MGVKRSKGFYKAKKMKLILPQKKKQPPLATPDQDTQSLNSIPFEVLEGLFQKALDRANARCAENPDLLDKYDAEGDIGASKRLNLAWQGCLEGKATIEDFREAVAEWERAVLPEEGLCRGDRRED